MKSFSSYSGGVATSRMWTSRNWWSSTHSASTEFRAVFPRILRVRSHFPARRSRRSSRTARPRPSRGGSSRATAGAAALPEIRRRIRIAAAGFIARTPRGDGIGALRFRMIGIDSVLLEVVAEVALVDPEEAGGLLPHPRRPLQRLDDDFLLPHRQHGAQVQLGPPGEIARVGGAHPHPLDG